MRPLSLNDTIIIVINVTDRVVLLSLRLLSM